MVGHLGSENVPETCGHEKVGRVHISPDVTHRGKRVRHLSEKKLVLFFFLVTTILFHHLVVHADHLITNFDRLFHDIAFLCSAPSCG